MKIDIQRLRNLTTGILHTEAGHIYLDIEAIVCETGIYTHMLPNACRALEPYLKKHLKDQRFWDGKFDLKHIGQVEIPVMGESEMKEFWTRYGKMESPLKGKSVMTINSLPLKISERKSNGDMGTN